MSVARNILLSIAISASALQTYAQDLGTYFSPCDPAHPNPQVQIGNDYGDGLSSNAYCSTPNALKPGYEYCTSYAFDAYFTDTQQEYKCAESLDSTCNGGCPSGTMCLVSNTAGPGTPLYYFCGVQCAGHTFLCDNAGAQNLGQNYVAYCNSDTDECGTCSSFADLSADLGTCSNPVTAFAPYQSGGKRKRQLRQSVQDYNSLEVSQCPHGSISCSNPDISGQIHQECIEYLEDLYSCGGCIGSGGVDCTSLVDDDTTVSCEQGQCVIYEETIGGGSVQSGPQRMARTPTKTIGGASTLSRSLKRAVDIVQITNKEQLRVKAWQEVTVVS